MNESNIADTTNNAAAKKPIFQSEHHDAIAELLGQKIVYGMMNGWTNNTLRSHKRNHKC